MTAARPRLRVGIVGAGRVGTALGEALRRAGHDVVAVSGVSDSTRRRLDQRLPGIPVRPPDQVARDAELVILAVPDDVLVGLVEGLAGMGALRSGQLVAHTSGAHGLTALAPAAAIGCGVFGLHPVMTFGGAPEDADRIRGAVFGITAADVLRPLAEALVLELDAEPVWVPDEARAIYHAALSWGANYLTTLVTVSSDLLAQAGVEQPARLLAPLLGAALDNALRRGDRALTGPISRGDAQTVAAHLQALREHAPAVVPAYVALARLTADRALHAGTLDPVAAERLLDVLT